MNSKMFDGLHSVTVRRGQKRIQDDLVVEEPLQIRVNGHDIAVLLRTPGSSPREDHALVAGFLTTEGVIDGLDDLRVIEHCETTRAAKEGNVVRVILASGTRKDAARLKSATRTQLVSGSCGVCGKQQIDDIFTHIEPHASWVNLEPAFVLEVAARLRQYQPRFNRSGGCHGASLFSLDGERLESAEDIGRHNAVDKVIGHALLNDRLPLDDTVLVVSSRAGFEIIQKALMARCRAVIAIGAASHLAHQLAERGRLSLYSFVRRHDFNHHYCASTNE